MILPNFRNRPWNQNKMWEPPGLSYIGTHLLRDWSLRYSRVTCLGVGWARVEGVSWGPGVGGLCAVSSNASWVIVTCEPPVDRQTHMSENITFPQICWRVVNILNVSLPLTRSLFVISQLQKMQCPDPNWDENSSSVSFPSFSSISSIPTWEKIWPHTRD